MNTYIFTNKSTGNTFAVSSNSFVKARNEFKELMLSIGMSFNEAIAAQSQYSAKRIPK